jgi:hypothetical protein
MAELAVDKVVEVLGLVSADGLAHPGIRTH